MPPFFKNSRVKRVALYGEAKGSVMTICFELEGQDSLAVNGGPVFTFSTAISLMIFAEVDWPQSIPRGALS